MCDDSDRDCADVYRGGLAVGVSQGLITDIRKVKAKGKEAKIWNKDAEIAYEDLIQTVSYMISPNTQRDKANPL